LIFGKEFLELPPLLKWLKKYPMKFSNR